MPAVLTALPDPEVVDGENWDGVEVTGEVGGAADAADVELSASRLAGVRLTGRRFDRLRLVDVLVENCDLSLALGVFAALEIVVDDDVRD